MGRLSRGANTDQRRTNLPGKSERHDIARFSWRIAALLLGAAALWVVVTLPGELRFIEESRRVETLIARVAVVPKRTILTVTVPDGAHSTTHDISVSTLRQWKVGDRVGVLMHPQGARVDDFFGRHPLSLPGIGGIGFLAVVLILVERTMARRRKAALR